jgi:hypothetical protein
VHRSVSYRSRLAIRAVRGPFQPGQGQAVPPCYDAATRTGWKTAGSSATCARATAIRRASRGGALTT